jgi:lipid-A-disaccharide synthase-like uncharacterized protein
MARRSLILLVLLLLGITAGSLWLAHRRAHAGGADGAAPFRMSDRLATVRVEEGVGGELLLAFSGNPERRMTPEEFALRLRDLQQEKQRGGWWFRALDITSSGGVFWVLLGFGGQFLFTGRMLVQWFASEKAKRSVVPPAFWWMSLFGSSLLIIYFSWRVDIVGILGQATGWVVYLRNLWLIQKTAGRAAT